MCGIIAYIGEKEAFPVLLNGLKALEYRGYDSVGICVKNSELITVKKKGKLREIEEDPKISSIHGNIGIGHIRWATHGEPNDINAHPHLNEKESIAIVHNGIIENYDALKAFLQKEGYKFKSQTDSEVIVHLIDRFYKDNLEKAVMKTVSLLEGAFGIVVLCKDKEEIIAMRKSSPLIIGLGENEKLIASDATAIVENTKNVVYLKDNEIAILRKDGVEIKNFDGEKVLFEVSEIKWNIEQLEKAGFKHFMLKEIFEQPESLEKTYSGKLKDNVRLSFDLDLGKIKRIVLLGCGTSWHSALIGKYLLEHIAKMPVEVDYASEFRYRDPMLGESDLVIAISQSGETADTLAAIKEAKERGAEIFGIVNVVGSTISRECGKGIYVHAGPEIGVASTKAFTSQIMALLLLALHLSEKKGLQTDKKIYEEIRMLPGKIKQILEQSEKIKEIAKEFKDSRNFLFLGRGINYPVALEGALKLKEISYIHAEGYPAAEVKHGPIALVDENMPSFFICTKDKTYDKVINNMQEVKARKGRILTLANEIDDQIKSLSEYIISIPGTNELLSPLINIIPLQLFAYHVADLKELDVDKPRNLAKSVTVE